MSQFYKVVPASCQCGGTQAWVIIHPSGVDEMLGCICHNVLPYDAKVIGRYIDRPHRDDPLPLFDEAELKRWRRRNFLRERGLEAYQPPLQVD
jgi:hypothetical protein